MSCKKDNQVQVLCEAKNCTFNEACKCTANTIDISGTTAHESKETQCSSFVNKEK